jgi:hypothetical protein
MRRITCCLVDHLPEPYKEALAIMYQIAPHFTGLAAMIFPDFVEVRGLEHPDLSIPALSFFTRFFSSEFAIRPFIMQYPERMLPQ